MIKKMILLLMLVIMLTACSTDDSGVVKKSSDWITCDDGRQVLDQSKCNTEIEVIPSIPEGTISEPILEVEASTRASVNSVEDAEDVFKDFYIDRDYKFLSAEKVSVDSKEYYKVIYRDNELRIKSLIYIDSKGNVFKSYSIT